MQSWRHPTSSWYQSKRPIKGKVHKSKESNSVPSTLHVGDLTYYLNKVMEKAFINRGANSGICGKDMLFLEGSERFVDVFGPAGRKVSQLQFNLAQAFISTCMGDLFADFTNWCRLVMGLALFLLIRQKLAVQTSMINPAHYHMVNISILSMVIRFHYVSRLAFQPYAVATPLKMNLLYCCITL
jgi:hypothetical protein